MRLSGFGRSPKPQVQHLHTSRTSRNRKLYVTVQPFNGFTFFTSWLNKRHFYSFYMI